MLIKSADFYQDEKSAAAIHKVWYWLEKHSFIVLFMILYFFLHRTSLFATANNKMINWLMFKVFAHILVFPYQRKEMEGWNDPIHDHFHKLIK